MLGKYFIKYSEGLKILFPKLLMFNCYTTPKKYK